MSRNQREGRYMGKLNGKPARVPLRLRAASRRYGWWRQRINYRFAPCTRY